MCVCLKNTTYKDTKKVKQPIFKHCLYIKLYEFVYRMRAHAQTQKILLLISSNVVCLLHRIYYPMLVNNVLTPDNPLYMGER